MNKRHLKTLKRKARKEIKANNLKRIIAKYGDMAFKNPIPLDQIKPGQTTALSPEQVNQIFGLTPEEIKEKTDKAKTENENS